jgi:hypothetical protein
MTELNLAQICHRTSDAVSRIPGRIDVFEHIPSPQTPHFALRNPFWLPSGLVHCYLHTACHLNQASREWPILMIQIRNSFGLLDCHGCHLPESSLHHQNNGHLIASGKLLRIMRRSCHEPILLRGLFNVVAPYKAIPSAGDSTLSSPLTLILS